MGLFKINDTIIGDGQQPLMFAEEGQANQGDLEMAKRMCDIALSSGADGIEYQLFLAKDMYIPSNPHFQSYTKKELSKEEIQTLVSYVKNNGLLFQAAVLSPEVIRWCVEFDVDVFCVNATDLNNPMILDPIIESGKPFWLATLMATLEEIDWAVSYIMRRGVINFGLLHGQHVMTSDDNQGVPPELLQLDCIHMMKERYGLTVGFVDHTSTVFTPQLAVAKGASAVMKHLSPEKGWRGPDWPVCLDPVKWAKANELFKIATKSGGMSKELSQMEVNDRSIHRRGLYLSTNKKEGDILQKEDLVALRPGKGAMDPRKRDSIVGMRITKELPMFHQVSMDDFV